MKISKSFTCKIGGNDKKVKFLRTILDQLKDLSEFVFDLGKDAWRDQKNLYHYCRHYFPDLNSKIIQNFLRHNYRPIKGRKLPKNVVKPHILIDYQSFNVHITDNKLSNFWLHFSRKNFPLFGKYLKNKITDPSNIKWIQIYERKGDLYCKLTYVIEKEDIKINSNPKVIGCDTNWYRMVFSDNSFYSTKRLAYRKIEHKKNKRKLKNYTKDFLHKLTTQISNDLQTKGVEVLVLEDLRSLSQSIRKKSGKSKGKLINYIINNFPYGMFQNFLTYKCLDRGIQVKKVNPAYTSITCSRCESKETHRPTQNAFICKDCNLHINADLNGSRNVLHNYMLKEGAFNESCPPMDH